MPHLLSYSQFLGLKFEGFFAHDPCLKFLIMGYLLLYEMQQGHRGHDKAQENSWQGVTLIFAMNSLYSHL